MIAEPLPVASLMLMPKSVRPSAVTVAEAGPCTLVRKKGSRLVNSARRSAGDAITAACGCQAPSGDSGVSSVQSNRTHCQMSNAASRPTSSAGQISRGERLPRRSHKGRARGSRTADPDISVAMKSSLSPN